MTTTPRDGSKELEFDCDISYYNEDGAFLGIDEESLYQSNAEIGHIVPFTACLNIPKDTRKAVLRFRSERKNSKWDLVIGASFITGIVVFLVWSIALTPRRIHHINNYAFGNMIYSYASCCANNDDFTVLC